MKKIVKILDALGFFIFALPAALAIVTIICVGSLFKRRAVKRSGVNRFSFVISDFIGQKYPSMVEDALLDGYISRDYSIYLDFSAPEDRFEVIAGRLFAYNIAAHPDSAIYRAGFRKMNMLIMEIKVLARSFSIIRKNDISFIKAHDPHLLGLNGIIMSRIFRLPCILHLNSDFDMKYVGTGKTACSIFMSRGLERLFESIVIRACDIVMADRKFYRTSGNFPKGSLGRYRAFGVRVDSIHYADPGSRKDLKGRLRLDGKKILLYVGRLHRVKYPEDAIKALKAISEKVDNAVLLMAGTGIMEDCLKAMARDAGLQDKVIFLGYRPQEELVDLLYTADILLAPHGGVTLLEAALAATPIVAYDFDWHPEFIQNGKMGYIVPFRDSDAMAEKAMEILMNEGLKEAMGSFCREAAVSKYSRRSSLRNEKRIYDEVMRP